MSPHFQTKYSVGSCKSRSRICSNTKLIINNTSKNSRSHLTKQNILPENTEVIGLSSCTIDEHKNLGSLHCKCKATFTVISKKNLMQYKLQCRNQGFCNLLFGENYCRSNAAWIQNIASSPATQKRVPFKLNLCVQY